MKQPSIKTERRLQFLIDWGERLIVLIMFAGLAVRIGATVANHPYNAVVLISEAMLVVLILCRRSASSMTFRARDWLIAMVGTILPLSVRPAGDNFAPNEVAFIVMLLGLALSVWAKLSLQRSFGLAAANRGIMIAGPYRLLRHPMYAGYAITFIGFLLANPLAWNFAVCGIAMVCQVLRILAEERLLRADPAYVELSARTRYRLLPGVF